LRVKRRIVYSMYIQLSVSMTSIARLSRFRDPYAQNNMLYPQKQMPHMHIATHTRATLGVVNYITYPMFNSTTRFGWGNGPDHNVASTFPRYSPRPAPKRQQMAAAAAIASKHRAKWTDCLTIVQKTHNLFCGTCKISERRL